MTYTKKLLDDDIDRLNIVIILIEFVNNKQLKNRTYL